MLTGDFTVTITCTGEVDTTRALVDIIKSLAPWMVDNVDVYATAVIKGGNDYTVIDLEDVPDEMV